ncbi:hypothetical protein FFRU_040250 [Fructobacillus fructosus]|uniref:glycohydrolase toxin TNT-related protein n=1 Tax=Fructobacillus fructosus TaxID=1631 RepID=UPI000219474A|nr:glycohydrolase toxin TNT-related protein [Fructobacillus fructosus]KRN52772.1 hypothetical protein IV71_GL000932 [Fructobacillus fructosus KCTC 3544]GAP01091.1 hypothetical protein FFRU_040250 [Fructobacillus fructosus]
MFFRRKRKKEKETAEAADYLMDMINRYYHRNTILDRYYFKNEVDNGCFFSDTENNVPYEQRGLPYPKETQEYHQYLVKDLINNETMKKAYERLSDKEKYEFSITAKRWHTTVEGLLNEKIVEGRIGPAFGYDGSNPDARQIVTPISVSWLKAMGFLEDVDGTTHQIMTNAGINPEKEAEVAEILKKLGLIEEIE